MFCSMKTLDGRTALDTAADTATASVFDGRMELALERVKLMTRAAKDRAKTEGDMRKQAEEGIEVTEERSVGATSAPTTNQSPTP